LDADASENANSLTALNPPEPAIIDDHHPHPPTTQYSNNRVGISSNESDSSPFAPMRPKLAKFIEDNPPLPLLKKSYKIV
jgi:hypothetical protein